MRYPAAEKLEIIRLVETSPLALQRTLAQIGIPRSTFGFQRRPSGPQCLQDALISGPTELSSARIVVRQSANTPPEQPSKSRSELRLKRPHSRSRIGCSDAT